MFDTKLKLRYLLSDLKLWHTKKSGLVRTQRTTNDQQILVDPVEDEDVEDSSTDWSSKLLTMRSKEKEECYSHCYSLILIESIITLLLYIGFGK